MHCPYCKLELKFDNNQYYGELYTCKSVACDVNKSYARMHFYTSDDYFIPLIVNRERIGAIEGQYGLNVAEVRIYGSKTLRTPFKRISLNTTFNEDVIFIMRVACRWYNQGKAA